MKEYRANSDISVSVTLPNKKSTRISFSALSNGSSVLYTSDKDIQWALEHHYKFGKLFRLVGESSEQKPTRNKTQRTGQDKPSAPKSGKKADKTKKTDEPVDHPVLSAEDETENPEVTVSDETDNDTSVDDEASEYTEVTVSDMDAAKDYLAENYEVVRTKLKSEDSIREAALSFGIIFKYL